MSVDGQLVEQQPLGSVFVETRAQLAEERVEPQPEAQLFDQERRWVLLDGVDAGAPLPPRTGAFLPLGLALVALFIRSFVRVVVYEVRKSFPQHMDSHDAHVHRVERVKGAHALTSCRFG